MTLPRSGSWPNLSKAGQDQDAADQNDRGQLQKALYSINVKETELSEMKEQFNALERHCTELEQKLRTSEQEKSRLQIVHSATVQTNRTQQEQLQILEEERDSLRQQLVEMQATANDKEEAVSLAEKRARLTSNNLHEKLQELSKLKKTNEELDTRIKQLTADKGNQSALERKVELQQTEIVDLTGKIQTLEQSLRAKSEGAQGASQLRLENQEMQSQIMGLVKQNVAQERQLTQMRREMDTLETQNLQIRETQQEYLAAKSVGGSPSPSPRARKGGSPRAGSSQKASTPPAREAEEGLPNLFDEIQKSDYADSPRDSKSKAFGDEKDWVDWDENKNPQRVLNDLNKADALEEYLHLTCAAVKICFPSVPISSEELIKKADKLPFYRIHDVLSRFMMQKLQWQETQRKKALEKQMQEKEEAKPAPSLMGRLKGRLFGKTTEGQNRTAGAFGFLGSTAGPSPEQTGLGMAGNRPTPASIAL